MTNKSISSHNSQWKRKGQELKTEDRKSYKTIRRRANYEVEGRRRREYVYNMLQFSYGWYFAFVQGWVYIFLIYLQGFTPKQMVNPWKTYVKLSAVLMGSNGLTKGSLAFLNYPAQLMFKSTKELYIYGIAQQP
ncbi:unnamed protein product [Fraxinus pennsylvanica]|uniref:Uncharacterized protein n=1 Tax=Fraxinus pennsylvanica TaxID=56036 RepID=A0AAD2ACD3_9LAMI|nr:unnamed protein product [Fraxinus pennsylvanica]